MARIRDTIVNFRGRRVTLSQAVRESGTGIPVSVVHDRLRSGWTLERALTLSVKPKGRWNMRALEPDRGAI